MREELTHTPVVIGGEELMALSEVARETAFATEPDAILMQMPREPLSVEKAGIFPAGPPCEDPYREPELHMGEGYIEHAPDVPTGRVPGMFYREPIPNRMSVASPLIDDRAEIERICQTPEANKMASEPLDLKKDQVTYADHQIFSTELERRLDDLGLIQHDQEEKKRPGMKAHLEFGTWMVPHRRILHTPEVKVKPSHIPKAQQPKDMGPGYAIEHVDKYFEHNCNPFPPRPYPGMNLANQEALFFNNRQAFPKKVREGDEIKLFSEVTIAEGAPVYAPEEIAALGPDTLAPDLECPMHFFGPPEGDWTGTTIQIRSPGEYHTERGKVYMEAGTFKVYRTKAEAILAKNKKTIAKHREAKIWYEKVAAYDMTEVMRLRISRQVRNNIQYNLTSGQRFRRYGLPSPADQAEQKARDTLRDLISEADWRRYVTNGFIMVRGESGKWYQIFRGGEGNVRIYQGGKLFGSVCIHSLDCPPTDHVIAMKMLVEFDEDAVISEGNFHSGQRDNVWAETIQAAVDQSVKILQPNLIETVKQIRHGMVI